MPAEYDARLLESLAIRRKRLRDVFVWGPGRDERAVGDNVKRIAIGLIIAAVIGAGCVGWNLISGLMDKQQDSGAARLGGHSHSSADLTLPVRSSAILLPANAA